MWIIGEFSPPLQNILYNAFQIASHHSTPHILFHLHKAGKYYIHSQNDTASDVNIREAINMMVPKCRTQTQGSTVIMNRCLILKHILQIQPLLAPFFFSLPPSFLTCTLLY